MKRIKHIFFRCFLRHWIFTFITIVTGFSCSFKNYTSGINYAFHSSNGKPDYYNLDYWAAHPWKKNPSDNTPAFLSSIRDSIADVFFIYPTTYLDPLLGLGWNAPIDDENINRKTDNTAILYQASVFNSSCRIFAPRYRQANLKAFYTSEKSAADSAFEIAYRDIADAFQFYLKNYNHGRPIIIASHSQGTLHAGHLLKDFFENKELQKQLVCAYIIGLPVFTNYFSQLPPCNDSSSTGCFVSWRSFKKGAHPAFVEKEKEKAIVTNPLTWKTDGQFASSKLNKGGILKNFDKLYPNIVSAQVNGNILWVSKPRFFGNIFLRSKNYHIADYNLFYNNIRENVRQRISTFLRNKEFQKGAG